MEFRAGKTEWCQVFVSRSGGGGGGGGGGGVYIHTSIGKCTQMIYKAEIY